MPRESRRRLDEIGTTPFGGLAGTGNFLVGKLTDFQDNLHYGHTGGVDDSGYVRLDGAPVIIFDGSYVDDHVDLISAIIDGSLGFSGLNLAQVCARGETDDRTHTWGVSG